MLTKREHKEPRRVFFTGLSCLLSDITSNNDHDKHVKSKIINMEDINPVIKDKPGSLEFCYLHKLVHIYFTKNKKRELATHARDKDCIVFCRVTNNLCPIVANSRYTPFAAFFHSDYCRQFLTFGRKPFLFSVPESITKHTNCRLQLNRHRILFQYTKKLYNLVFQHDSFSKV